MSTELVTIIVSGCAAVVAAFVRSAVRAWVTIRREELAQRVAAKKSEHDDRSELVTTLSQIQKTQVTLVEKIEAMEMWRNATVYRPGSVHE
jgi:hypothetical protein